MLAFSRSYEPLSSPSVKMFKVRDLVERCKCPVQFPMIRVSEGKYRIGDTKVLIFVRILRKHVMVRVGGGWDTLSHYLDKHDPCRCKTAHRSPINAKLVLKSGGANMDLGSAHVYYDRSPPRTRRSSASSVGSTGGGGNVNMASLIPAPSQAGGGGSRNRSRSRSPTHAPALRPPSFRSSTHCLVQEPSATPTDTPLNDSSSEVSDEGYRSLGPLVMTPQSSTHILDVNTPLNTNANNLGIPKDERVHWESSTLDCKVTDASRKAYYASLLQIEHHSAVLLHPPSECNSNKFPSDEISITNAVENERPTINSLINVGSTICINHLDNVSLKQSKSRSSSIDSSESRKLPRNHITVPTQDRSRRTSHSPARSTANTKSQGRSASGGETTIISSISPKKMAADKNLSPKHNYGESSSASSSLSKATGKQPSGLNNNNTWNGRPGKSKEKPTPVHPTKIQTLVSPSSAVQLNTKLAG
uniref:GAR domain-containing protein n=1 Tax=Timema douglasi TaxID=61478 RepID=A0A7R8VIE6_TIMDO|nr:unnamed protein product [Timema douglasi]